MRAPRLLLLWLLISICVATTAAQSSPRNNSDSQPLPSQSAQASPDLLQFQLQSGTDSRVAPVLRPHVPHIATLELDDATCYTIRAYRVARENPDSDVVRPVGYSTCQRASRFQFKTAVDSIRIAPR